MLRSYLGITIAVVGLWAGSEFCRARLRRRACAPDDARQSFAAAEVGSSDARDLRHRRPTATGAGTGGRRTREERERRRGTDQRTSKVPGRDSGCGRAHWSGAISAATLEDEVKAQGAAAGHGRADAHRVQRGAYKGAREELTMLAVLFAVIGQYDGDVRWQKEAATMRDLFGRAGMNCKVGTDNSFNEAKLRSQDLAELIRGGAVETRTADEEFQWPAVANRPPLMKRMEKSLRERLGPWTAGAGEFRKNRDAIVREAEILAILARVIRAEGYEYADDAAYRQYVDELERECRDIIDAVKNGNLQQGKARPPR